MKDIKFVETYKPDGKSVSGHNAGKIITRMGRFSKRFKNLIIGNEYQPLFLSFNLNGEKKLIRLRIAQESKGKGQKPLVFCGVSALELRNYLMSLDLTEGFSKMFMSIITLSGCGLDLYVLVVQH